VAHCHPVVSRGRAAATEPGRCVTRLHLVPLRAVSNVACLSAARSLLLSLLLQPLLLCSIGKEGCSGWLAMAAGAGLPVCITVRITVRIAGIGCVPSNGDDSCSCGGGRRCACRAGMQTGSVTRPACQLHASSSVRMSACVAPLLAGRHCCSAHPPAAMRACCRRLGLGWPSALPSSAASAVTLHGGATVAGVAVVAAPAHGHAGHASWACQAYMPGVLAAAALLTPQHCWPPMAIAAASTHLQLGCAPVAAGWGRAARPRRLDQQQL
jgi:hypothetical protein